VVNSSKGTFDSGGEEASKLSRQASLCAGLSALVSNRISTDAPAMVCCNCSASESVLGWAVARRLASQTEVKMPLIGLCWDTELLRRSVKATLRRVSASAQQQLKSWLHVGIRNNGPDHCPRQVGKLEACRQFFRALQPWTETYRRVCCRIHVFSCKLGMQTTAEQHSC